MSYFSQPLHIRARQGDVAERVIVVGDPKRVDAIKLLLDDFKLVSDNRGFYTYTGLYKGVPITISVHGVGGPSASIVFEELNMLGAKIMVRFGTAGALIENLGVGDVVLALSASYYRGGLYNLYTVVDTCMPAVADYHLLRHIEKYMEKYRIRYIVDSVVSVDCFYIPVKDFVSQWSKVKVSAVDMETAALYILSRIKGFKAVSVLLISNSLIKETGYLSADELREYVIRVAEPLLEGLVSFPI
jgi:5'-methylthioadenosine phosphorylase